MARRKRVSVPRRGMSRRGKLLAALALGTGAVGGGLEYLRRRGLKADSRLGTIDAVKRGWRESGGDIKQAKADYQVGLAGGPGVMRQWGRKLGVVAGPSRAEQFGGKVRSAKNWVSDQYGRAKTSLGGMLQRGGK